MKSLIITVAGMSSRFNKDTKEDVLKCLYYEDTPANSLISLQVHKCVDLVDEIIVVGGYKYEDLESFIRKEMKDVNKKMKLVYNDHYHDYGSGYSLLKGIEAVSENVDEIIFIEGDLFFDSKSVKEVISSPKDVISVNNDPILSNKAVALYFDAQNYPHYIYDTSHFCLEIHEPFTAIYNSGQMWKFQNPTRVKEICKFLTPEQEQGTNLEIIQKYFGTYKNSQLDIIRVNLWFNCNTVADYRESIKALSA
jgi:CTP:molybdopterin cytidylyltransferase MocA